MGNIFLFLCDENRSPKSFARPFRGEKKKKKLIKIRQEEGRGEISQRKVQDKRLHGSGRTRPHKPGKA